MTQARGQKTHRHSEAGTATTAAGGQKTHRHNEAGTARGQKTHRHSEAATATTAAEACLKPLRPMRLAHRHSICRTGMVKQRSPHHSTHQSGHRQNDPLPRITPQHRGTSKWTDLAPEPQNPHRHNKTDATSCDARAQRIEKRPQHETHKHKKK